MIILWGLSLPAVPNSPLKLSTYINTAIKKIIIKFWQWAYYKGSVSSSNSHRIEYTSVKMEILIWSNKINFAL